MPETGELRQGLMSMPPETGKEEMVAVESQLSSLPLMRGLFWSEPEGLCSGEEEIVAAKIQLSSLPLRCRLLLRLMVWDATVTEAWMPV